AFRGAKYKWLPIICGSMYIISWLTDFFYFSKFHFFFYSFSYTVGNFLLLILILNFFIRLATSDAIITFRQNMLFWMSLGMLIYYLGSFPYFGLRNTIAYNYREINITYNYIVFI